MKKKLSFILVCLLIVAMFVGCSSSTTQEPTAVVQTGAEETSSTESSQPVMNEKFVIKLGHVRAADDPCNIALEAAAERILERTDGNVEIQIYPNGELASYENGVEAIRSDAAYIFYSSPGQLSDYVPEYCVLQCPYLYDSFETYEKLMDTSVIQGLKDQAEAQGIHTINLDFLTGFRFILADKPITKVEDVKGLKIRLPNNKVWTEPFGLMEANITTMAWSEVYTGLQQGIVDACEGDPALIYNSKLYEVKKVISETNHLLDLSGTFIGSGYWATLPTEYQDIITEEFNNAAYENNRAYEELIKEDTQKLKDLGVTFYPVEMEGFKEATKSLVLQYECGEDWLAAIDSVNNN